MSKFVNHNRFVRAQDHPQIAYLKQDQIGKVISKGLSKLYKQNPSNPLHFLGNWLINHASTVKNQTRMSTNAYLIADLKEKHRLSLQQAANIQQKKLSQIEAQKAKQTSFQELIKSSLDVDDLLTALANHLKQGTNATSVYIGILEQIKRSISDLDDENAHIEPSAPYVIRYIATSLGSEEMIDQILKEQQGEATYSIWKPDQKQEQEEEQEELIKTCFVPDVVNDARIKFFDVPKLGSYLAIPLTYETCLFQSSFDTAVQNAIECRRLRAEQEQEKQKLSQAASSKRDQEQVPEEEEKQFEQIKEDPYQSQTVKWVVCLDTMNQDRAFTSNQQEYALNWVQFFRQEWQRAENACMLHDVTTHIAQNDGNMQILHDKEADWAQEERSALEDSARDMDASMAEDLKSIESNQSLLNLLRDRLLEPEFFNQILLFKEFKIVKFCKVFQLAFYYFGVPKNLVVEAGTNRIKWKIAKENLGDGFKNSIQTLTPCGSNPHIPPIYAKTARLQRELAKIAFDDIRQYSLPLSILYQFLEQALKLRIMDVTFRRKEYLARKEQHQAAVTASKELEEKRQTQLEQARQKHQSEEDQRLQERKEQEQEQEQEEGQEPAEAAEEDERIPFDEQKFLSEFDDRDSNAPVEIPDEVFPEEDGDLDWSETNP